MLTTSIYTISTLVPLSRYCIIPLSYERHLSSVSYKRLAMLHGRRMNALHLSYLTSPSYPLHSKVVTKNLCMFPDLPCIMWGAFAAQ